MSSFSAAADGVAPAGPDPVPPATGDDLEAWRQALAPYATPRVSRSVLDLLTSAVPCIGCLVLMYLSLRVSYFLALALAIPAAGFQVRTFIVFHDCTHGSFLPSKRANAWVGTLVGLLTFSCFAAWRHAHLVHHATAGDLDRRGVGDMPTKTVAEYRDMSRSQRRIYRLMRHPLVLFGIGPLLVLVIQPRVVTRTARPRIRRRVYATDLALAGLVGTLVWAVGWPDYLLVELPVVMLAGAVGIWLFFVQHQFEGVYWETGEQWSYAQAALAGSSYLKLPPPLQFFTGNIGLHHVHHLSARIPNYNLQRAHDETAIFASVPVLSLGAALRAVRLKLYDAEARHLVTFAEADAIARRCAAELPEDVNEILERARALGVDPARVLSSLGFSSADG
jgi:omega-6 fatty acid desaturase (delta-12 desaturase)